MKTLEKVFVKTRSYMRQFDLQTRLSESHKKLNIESYNKAMHDFDEAITDLIKEKLSLLIEEGNFINNIKDDEIDTEIDTPPKNDDNVSPNDNKDEPKDNKDFNSYFRVTILGGVEIRDNVFKTDTYIAINRDTCKNDAIIVELLKKKQIARCRKSSCKDVQDINHLYVEEEVTK